MSTEENKAIVRRFIHDGVIGGDLDLIDELCSPDCVNHSALPEARARKSQEKLSEGKNYTPRGKRPGTRAAGRARPGRQKGRRASGREQTSRRGSD